MNQKAEKCKVKRKEYENCLTAGPPKKTACLVEIIKSLNMYVSVGSWFTLITKKEKKKKNTRVLATKRQPRLALASSTSYI